MFQQLFQTHGNVTRIFVKYDRSGRSEGIAEVSFAEKNEARNAMDAFNGIPLDGNPIHLSSFILLFWTIGMPMKIELIQPSQYEFDRLCLFTDVPFFHRTGPNLPLYSSSVRGRTVSWRPAFPRSSTRRGSSKLPRGNRDEVSAPPTSVELDADLDSYMQVDVSHYSCFSL